MGHDLIRPDTERMGALRMTDAALPVLRAEQSILLRKDTLKKTQKGAEAKALVGEEDAPLLAALKAQRRRLAEAAHVPAYIIFNDRTLIEMAQSRPETLDDMARINGVGAKKLENYGLTFLNVINESVTQPHPQRRKLAGRKDGELYDRLLEVQADLSRGAQGIDKPLSCSAALLAKLVKLKPRDLDSMAKVLGDQKTHRFGQAFLDVFEKAP